MVSQTFVYTVTIITKITYHLCLHNYHGLHDIEADILKLEYQHPRLFLWTFRTSDWAYGIKLKNCDFCCLKDKMTRKYVRSTLRLHIFCKFITSLCQILAQQCYITLALRQTLIYSHTLELTSQNATSKYIQNAYISLLLIVFQSSVSYMEWGLISFNPH